MPSFEPADVVRIARLEIPTRDVDGASAEPPQPRVGEIAVVVDALGDDVYLVERVTDDGHPLWVAEFRAAELDLVNRSDDA
jgi:hypothetical protein